MERNINLLLTAGNTFDWVTTDNRRFYTKLVNDSELLAKVTNSIALHPADNKALAESLVKLGLQKQDGTPLDSASMSRIKGVFKNRNTETNSEHVYSMITL